MCCKLTAKMKQSDNINNYPLQPKSRLRTLSTIRRYARPMLTIGGCNVGIKVKAAKQTPGKL
jgi:hypothetical protein